MSYYKFVYSFFTLWVLKSLPVFFFMARPEGLRFTSEKTDSDFSHKLQILFSKLNLKMLTATKGRGVGELKIGCAGKLFPCHNNSSSQQPY